MFVKRYADVFDGGEAWKAIEISEGLTYGWQDDSTYVKHPPFFEDLGAEIGPIADIANARPLAILGDTITTDHISPAGVIKADSPAGKYLMERGVDWTDFNSFGSRRGNHEVMMRGTFANIRLQNEMTPGKTGGWTKLMPGGKVMPIYDAAMKYEAAGVPLIIVAGQYYGTGSSRDWAAKGTRLLGVKAVITESFERIHRSNLVGMGVLPLQFKDGVSRKTLKLDGTETFDLIGVAAGVREHKDITLKITRADGSAETAALVSRVDTAEEMDYFQNGGILHYVLRNMLKDG